MKTVLRVKNIMTSTQKIVRKMLYSNMKLHVSAYNGHRQVSIPINLLEPEFYI